MKIPVPQWVKKPKAKEIILSPPKKKDMPAGLFVRCPGCEEILWPADLERNLMVCKSCGYHHQLPLVGRIKLLTDPDTFTPLFEDVTTADRLVFADYQQKLAKGRAHSDSGEAVVVGTAKLNGRWLALGVMVFSFMGGSMGVTVGERIARLFEYALEQNLSVVLVIASGGARMQEGILSLMQMAKVAAALGRFGQARLPYIAVLTNPSTAGVMASFGATADVIIAEPGAVVGFAGERVIKQTIGLSILPRHFQKSEWALDHGFIDMIVERRHLPNKLGLLLCYLSTHCRSSEPPSKIT